MPLQASASSPPPTAPYQVLARKWRPRAFADLVGQEHVVQALTHALERGQLHHAYLFTGTRGVGKTTLARILAKSLNCEQGVSAQPCGVCSSCREIHEGRFIDLQEVDAASRTKVDQTRELLENIPFAPVRGRYKVYLIDEVHMFSTSSFNALLKTLEEPPAHVKFVLATTDPQKLPATVLSRCLQFNLKHLLPEQIQAQFRLVLETEGVEFEEPALGLLARAADGSMRDGLSLLDQGIAFGGGALRAADVRAMLGTLDHDLILALVEALCDNDAPRLLAEIARVAQLTPDFAGVLKALIELLHRLALAQQVPKTLNHADPDHDRLQALIGRIAPEDVQLYYQIAIMGQQDLPLAPDPRAGLEMVLLRALAFRPDTEPVVRAKPGSAAASSAQSGSAPVSTPTTQGGNQSLQQLANSRDWHHLVSCLPVDGLGQQLASHCAFQSWQNGDLCLELEPDCEHLMRAEAAKQRLATSLQDILGQPVRLCIQTRRSTQETPARRQARETRQRQREVETLMGEDPIAQGLLARLDAEWVPDSIRPLD